MTIVNGKRSVAYIGSARDVRRNMDLINQNNLKVYTFKKNDNTVGGIVYSDEAKGNHLLSIVKKRGGYMSHKNAQEGIENGEALEYNDSDIKTWIDHTFGDGSYDKIKMKY